MALNTPLSCGKDNLMMPRQDSFDGAELLTLFIVRQWSARNLNEPSIFS
jgi:hypothetical protein